MATEVSTSDPQAYAEYLNRVRPRLIQSEAEFDAVQRLMDQLMETPTRSPEDDAFLDFLTRLLLEWERGKYPEPSPAPLEILRNLLADDGYRQADLVGPVFPTKSRASEVLSGKRPLTYNYVDRLAAFFHVPPSLFFPRNELGSPPECGEDLG
jgi:HTH-type transcriptional regulator/antitoxin HigA